MRDGINKREGRKDGGEDRGQVFEGRIEGELARPRGGIALSPRHFYVFKPVNKFWRSPIVATRPLPLEIRARHLLARAFNV